MHYRRRRPRRQGSGGLLPLTLLSSKLPGRLLDLLVALWCIHDRQKVNRSVHQVAILLDIPDNRVLEGYIKLAARGLLDLEGDRPRLIDPRPDDRRRAWFPLGLTRLGLTSTMYGVWGHLEYEGALRGRARASEGLLAHRLDRSISGVHKAKRRLRDLGLLRSTQKHTFDIDTRTWKHHVGRHRLICPPAMRLSTLLAPPENKKGVQGPVPLITYYVCAPTRAHGDTKASSDLDDAERKAAYRRDHTRADVLWPYLVGRLLEIGPYDPRDSAKLIGLELDAHLLGEGACDPVHIIAALEHYTDISGRGGKYLKHLPIHIFLRYLFAKWRYPQELVGRGAGGRYTSRSHLHLFAGTQGSTEVASSKGAVTIEPCEGSGEPSKDPLGASERPSKAVLPPPMLDIMEDMPPPFRRHFRDRESETASRRRREAWWNERRNRVLDAVEAKPAEPIDSEATEKAYQAYKARQERLKALENETEDERAARLEAKARLLQEQLAQLLEEEEGGGGT